MALCGYSQPYQMRNSCTKEPILYPCGMPVCWHAIWWKPIPNMDLSAVAVSIGCQHGPYNHCSHLVLLLSDIAGVVPIVQ